MTPLHDVELVPNALLEGAWLEKVAFVMEAGRIYRNDLAAR